MMRLVAISVISILALLMPAYADDTPMPTYDVSTFCLNHHEDGDERKCVALQCAYRSLANRNWSRLSEAVRKECISADKWGDYQILVNCTNR